MIKKHIHQGILMLCFAGSKKKEIMLADSMISWCYQVGIFCGWIAGGAWRSCWASVEWHWLARYFKVLTKFCCSFLISRASTFSVVALAFALTLGVLGFFSFLSAAFFTMNAGWQQESQVHWITRKVSWSNLAMVTINHWCQKIFSEKIQVWMHDKNKRNPVTHELKWSKVMFPTKNIAWKLISSQWKWFYTSVILK